MQTKNSPIFRFYLATFGGSFALFWALVSYSWGRNQVQKQFKTYLCGQLTLVFEVQPYVLFLIWSNLGPFCTFGAIRGYFWGWGQVQKLFWDLLTQTNNFYFGSIALSCFFETFPAGWVVGKSDFNENPVVSLDFDLDFGFQLSVC